jgi:chromosome segregation ATPase
MLKKMVILGVIGFIAVTAVRGTKIASYVNSRWSQAEEALDASIPPEQEIKRLRNEVKGLDRDIMTVVNQLAKERVDVNNLQADVAARADKQSADNKQLQARGQAIKDAEAGKTESTQHVVFGRRKLSIDEAKAELEADVKRCTTNQKLLDSMEQTLAQRIKIRDTLEKQLDTLKTQKQELTVAIDAMEAELTALKQQQIESKYQTDDTRLARIKDDLRKLKTRVDVEREKLKLMPVVRDTPAAPATSNKSVDDILAPLTAPAKPAKPEASKTDAKVPMAD